MMSVLDHLSTPSQYGPYLSQYTKIQETRKASPNANSQLDIKVSAGMRSE